ncbi:MAG: beta-N-acetylhexosaminidase [Ruthenibacterium sp.]
MSLLPKINGTIKEESGTFCLLPTMLVTCNSTFETAIELFENRMQKLCGIRVMPSGEQVAQLVILENTALATEEYVLTVEAQRICIEASQIAGANWGLTSLFHLIWQAKLSFKNELAQVRFFDAPKYRYRGLLVDVARHFFKVAELEKIIEQMAIYKLNVLHLHLTDDQGWRIESKFFPQLTQGSTEFYTQKEIKTLVEFAQKRNISIIPEIDIPGHVSVVLAAYPKLSCTGKAVVVTQAPGIREQILCAGNPDAMAWACKCLDEVCNLFPGKYLHIGGDEAPKTQWKQCPRCAKKMRECGAAKFEDLQGWFLSQVAQHLHQKGKTAICWNDCLMADALDKKIAVQYWSESAPTGYCTAEKIAGRDMVYSEVFSNYFDYPYAVTPLRKTYEYVPHIGNKTVEFDAFLCGVEGAIWTEHVTTCEALEQLVFPRMMALAENAWSNTCQYDDFLKRLPTAVRLSTAMGVCCTPLNLADLSGKARLKAAGNYFKKTFTSMQSGEIEMGMSAAELRTMCISMLNGFFEGEELQQVKQMLSLEECI